MAGRAPASRLKQQSTCLHQQSVCIPSRSLLHPAIQAQDGQHSHNRQLLECHDQHKQDSTLVSRRQSLASLALGVASTQLLQLASFCKEASAAVVDEDVATKVYAACRASVVSVVNYKGQSDVSTGVGSGFVWDQYGHIVTNYHVISKLDKSSDVSEVSED
jgi:S1-C subfamily serine protease